MLLTCHKHLNQQQAGRANAKLHHGADNDFGALNMLGVIALEACSATVQFWKTTIEEEIQLRGKSSSKNGAVTSVNLGTPVTPKSRSHARD